MLKAYTRSLSKPALNTFKTNESFLYYIDNNDFSLFGFKETINLSVYGSPIRWLISIPCAHVR